MYTPFGKDFFLDDIFSTRTMLEFLFGNPIYLNLNKNNKI